jgi:AraC-like DNA-binding protein
MALIDCKDPVFDRQVDRILKMLEEGKEKQDIAKALGYTNPNSLDNYMRRRNFSWDSRQQNFVPAAEKYSGKGRDNLLQLRGVSKAALVISLFSEEGANPKDIAEQVGFTSHSEMGTYMKRKGYEWDTIKGNYVKGKSKVDEPEKPAKAVSLEAGALEDVLTGILKTLGEIKESTKRSGPVDIGPVSKVLPRYQIKGGYGTKAIRMATVLDEMVRLYSQEHNVSQKDIMEVALVDFLRRYGEGDFLEEFLD